MQQSTALIRVSTQAFDRLSELKEKCYAFKSEKDALRKELLKLKVQGLIEEGLTDDQELVINQTLPRVSMSEIIDRIALRLTASPEDLFARPPRNFIPVSETTILKLEALVLERSVDKTKPLTFDEIITFALSKCK